MKAPIYRPSGPAREYSPLAINPYLECAHGCKYCYVPGHIHKHVDDFHVQSANPRDTEKLLNALDKQLKKLDKAGTPITEQVLLTFTGDPYSPSTDNCWITRQILSILNQYDVPTAILTKNPMKCYENDIDLIKRFKAIQIGTTLTCSSDFSSRLWEPNAPLPMERIEGLQKFTIEEIRTFASFEPLLDQDEALTMMDRLLIINTADVVKLGKTNGYYEDKIGYNDYEEYLYNALKTLRGKRQIYVKEDLRKVTPDVDLTDDEKDMDRYNVRR